MDDASHIGESHRGALLRTLPSVDELLSRPSLKAAYAGHPRPRAVAATRLAVQQARERMLRGDARPFEEAEVSRALESLTRPCLRRVINATGVVLHTNLGRAPLAEEALARVAEVSRGYSNLEFELEEGKRGSRYEPVRALLCELTGAEDVLVVNNAAAVLLVLSALASGRECVVSRGELVEIGGGFRVPDVMRQSGCKLVEVGTTNRTRLSDYEEALGPGTALLVKVHPSNFAVVGFTESTPRKALVELGHRKGLSVFEDLGSGLLLPLDVEGLTPEPTVREVVSAGVDVVTFSGDKLLGGPQAGIIVGRRNLLERIRSHPLNRALRVDKMTVSALEATLELYRDGQEARVPAYRLLHQSEETLQARAERLRECLAPTGVQVRVERVQSQVGGGAMPLASPMSYACALGLPDLEHARERLRGNAPPVIARIAQDTLLLDVRCLADEDLETVATAVKALV